MVGETFHEGGKTPFKKGKLYKGLLYKSNYNYLTLVVSIIGRKYVTDYSFLYPTADDLYTAWEQAERRVYVEKTGYL